MPLPPGFIIPPNLPLPQGEGHTPSWVKRGKGELIRSINPRVDRVFKKSNILLNRKMLSEIAASKPETFKRLVAKV
jgi:hypothetical protein